MYIRFTDVNYDFNKSVFIENNVHILNLISGNSRILHLREYSMLSEFATC